MRWIHRTKHRYYSVHETFDLWGQLCLVLCWGSLDSRRGGLKTLVLAGEAERDRQIASLAKRRVQRGYEPVIPRSKQG